MAYEIKFTDQANKGSIFVEDNTINQETSVSLPGRNSTAFGTAIAENFLHLLENFANTSEPQNPVEGQLWYDSTPGVDQLKVYDGTAWAAAGGLKKATAEPDVANSVAGDLWVDTDNQQLYLFSGSGWILVGPSFSDGLNTGARPLRITGTDNRDYNVLAIEIEAQPVTIISTDQFTPKTAISGFSEIKPGINLSTSDIKGSGVSKFYGTAEKAESLLVGNNTVAASNFLRSDETSTTNFPLRVKNNGGIQLGANSQFTMGIEGESGVIAHRTSGAQINLRINDGGTNRNVLTIDGTSVGINNGAPDQALDVVGNIQTNSNLFVDGLDESTNFGNGALVVRGGAGIAKNLNVGGSLNITGSTVARDVAPDSNNTRNLGSESVRWQGVYANTFYGNVIGNVTGFVSGRASSADRISSSTTFQVVGDVSATAIEFDGQVGGNTKTFNTSISNTFIANKTGVGSTRSDDEILINRVSGGTTGLFKASRQALLADIPRNPPGIILPFAGSVIPSGWLLCAGQEVSRLVYPTLFSVIGFAFLDAGLVSDGGVEFFALPDLRGRLPLGLDNMGGTSANRVSGLQAEELGNSSGSEDVTIRKIHLPNHEHDMRAPNGDQFYAINDLAKGPSSDPSSIVYDAPTGTGVGQALESSGGVLDGGPNGNGTWRQITVGGNTEEVGSALNVINPFLALNYIIYTGDV